ncbi:MAG: hypothetical protein ACK4Q5_04085 [Saprospiraceae bacterium]
MAKINRPDHKGAPPLPPRPDTKGAPPPLEERSHNLSKRNSDRMVLINFKATEEFRKELKIYATELGMSITDVIMEAIEMHKSTRK